ncbi:hypothetical protein BSB_24900 [Bacillus stercoris]|nr:hypothetical protein BSB_24900 [Bacillus stercoris]
MKKCVKLNINKLQEAGDPMPNKSKPNRLIAEKSPYLLQHAHNPVDWFPWGEEAFEKAKRENKPVLVSIGYSTFHW